jgi:2,3-bisphosphoglycerate-independent phosphoglycerate mutase
MSARPARVLLLFLDGIGIGTDDPAVNPFALARLPTLQELLDGERLIGSAFKSRSISRPQATVSAVDPTMGVPGLPQSGTGQTALLTGMNAAAMFGRHFGSWVPTVLREPLRTRSLLARAAAAGRAVAFANANPPGTSLARRPSGPAIAAHGAGTLWRGPDELRAGLAVASSMTNERWISHLPESGIGAVAVEQAGRNLASIAAQADLTLFAHYDTDFAGHRKSLEEGVSALQRVDRFIGGLLERLPTDSLLVIASDHGNLEDVRSGHTRNPVPVLATGPGAREFGCGVRHIMDVAPSLLRLLAVTG